MYIRIACFWISDEDVRWKCATRNPIGVGNLVHSHIKIKSREDVHIHQASSHCIIFFPSLEPIQNGFSAVGRRIPVISPASSRIAPFSSRATISRGIAAAVPFRV